MDTPLDADQLLNDLTIRGEAPLLAQPGPPAALRLQKISYTHDAMIDMIIQEPSISQGKLALAFGYTQAWVSIVMASDAFQARLAERKEELIDPAIRATIEERFRAVTNRSLEILAEKLAKEADKIPDNLALRCAELGAKALGVGVPGAASAPQTGTDHLANLSHRLIDLLHKRSQPDGRVIDVSPQEGSA